MADQAMVGRQRGGTVLSFDGVDAYDSVKRARMLPDLEEYVHSFAGYASKLYARDPPKLLFRIDNGRTQVVHSRPGVAQGCNFGSLCYSMAMIGLLPEFRRNKPVEGATICCYYDHLATMLPRERSRDIFCVDILTKRREKHLLNEEVELNRQKSKYCCQKGLAPNPCNGINKAVWKLQDRQ